MTIEDQWSALTYLTNQTLIQSIGDKELASKYMLLLNGIRSDRRIGDVCVLGMYRAPGSKDRHHAVEGGLVAHLLEMWECWKLLRNDVMAAPIAHPITDALVWRAILHHDLNKIYRYKQITNKKDGTPVEGWEVDYTEANEDPLGHLLPSTYKSLGILAQYGISLSPMLMNALITAEGGFSSGPRPRTESVFAKLIYLCDELSANVLNRLACNLFWDSKHGGLSGVTNI